LSRVRHSSGRRRRKHEDHVNHEAWAIPYADLLTLLLAFFVVMYAISSVNSGKYRVLSDSLFAAFRGAPRSMQPIQVGERQIGSGTDMRPTVEQQAVLEGKASSSLKPVPAVLGLQKSGGITHADGKLPAQAAAAAAALSRVADEVERAMDELVKKDMVTVRRSDFWIEVEMRTDILFPSGSARLADSAVDIIQRLGSVLAPFPNPIRVEGHTDNKPIKTAVFYSNWELSAARAGSVVRVLSGHGVAPNRLAVIGYGEQRPMQTNDTAEGRNANRRVVVVILSTELMRQTDPAQMSTASSGANSTDPGATGTAATGTAAIGPTGTSATGIGPTGTGATGIGPTGTGATATATIGAAAVPAATNSSAAATAGAARNTNGITLSPATNGVNRTDAADSGAIASPADSPQALPAPAAPEPPTPAASAQTTRTDIQHNTGTEPAP
jgi:chemotaxis protein MotB